MLYANLANQPNPVSRKVLTQATSSYFFGLVVEQTDQLLDRLQVFKTRHVLGSDRTLPDSTCKSTEYVLDVG